jgi:hypothetical protein
MWEFAALALPGSIFVLLDRFSLFEELVDE